MEKFVCCSLVGKYLREASTYLKNPSFIAIFAAVLTAYFTNYFTQRSGKKNKLEAIKNNIVYTCDKLISYAIQTEKNQLSFRYHEYLFLESKKGLENIEKYLESTTEYEYRNFHDRALDSHIRFDLEKSKMNKHLHQLNSYDNSLAKEIAILFNKANGYTLRGFVFDFDNKNVSELHTYLNETSDGIKDHILYKSDLGINLREIMKILKLNVIKPKNRLKNNIV